ncbi:aminotransferase [Rhodococcus rhodochrous]|uniref:aminotransferase class V-fold PLP-dependent enzyme n=1 Tax=Rhodococcus TaxID=1827 RepID=UPI000B109401|nr:MULTISPECIES: aminotransferase class V-fold PLP-dependent enzyme [Rhodococcus]MDC3727527.1 aminotransferase class V-fold PLP-dependent enzyme [Rhodococcus sp. Rp3]TWH44766.1 monomeric sarcosine oxidase [Rhodococcus rhodochrous J38]SNV23780.1 aminotransferase [Rhodococcus rhodochrous]
MIDVADHRAHTPGAGLSHHLNAAGAALLSSGVLSTVRQHLELESRIGGYEADALARGRIDAVYDSAARLLGADSTDIALVNSATDGWHRALAALRLQRGDRVLVSRSSYVSSALHLLELRDSLGIEIEVVPNDAAGRIDLDALAGALKRSARLVTVAHVPTSSGLVEPVAEVGALCRAAGVTYLLDATQSVGQLPVDVATIGCDILVTTGRKFLRGPRGTGLLYVSPAARETLRPGSPDVRGALWKADNSYELKDSAVRFETWEASHALELGLGTALDEAFATGIDAITRHIGDLGSLLRAKLAGVAGVTVLDPPAAGGGIVTFGVDGRSALDVKEHLRRRGIRVVAVPAAHAQWDLGDRGIDAVVRASMHVYNGEDDLDALVEVLQEPEGVVRVPLPATPSLADLAPRRSAPVEAAESTDVVVVGAGIHGNSTAWQLARRGVRVIQLEQFSEGHVEGSSHGRARMIRRAYPNPIWYPLVDRAYRAWAELEEEVARPLITTTGGLYARALDAESGLDGPDCVMVDHVEAARRFPGLELGAGFRALYDPAAGVVDAAAAMAQLTAIGRRAGVDRREGVRVLGIDPDGDGAVVTTTAGRIRAARVVVCAGPWISELLPQFAPVLDVVRIVNIHVAGSRPEMLAPPNLGPFSIEVPGVGLMYGIPSYGGDTLKVGLDHGPEDDLTTARKPVSQSEIDVLHVLVRRFLPAADGAVVGSLSCRYTMAPNNRFALGPLPETPQILVAAACSGHGFKFGPAVGEALADLVTGVSRPDLDFLEPGRMLAPARV